LTGKKTNQKKPAKGMGFMAPSPWNPSPPSPKILRSVFPVPHRVNKVTHSQSPGALPRFAHARLASGFDAGYKFAAEAANDED